MPHSLAATAAALLALAPSSEVELVHAPASGTARTLTVETELGLDGGELICAMDGEDVPSEYLPELLFEMSDVRGMSLTETFESGSWLRSYDEVRWENDGSMGMDYGGQVQRFPWSAVAETPIEGRVVRLAGEDDGSLRREFEDGGSDDDELLEGLRADLGLGVLLPGQAVAEGSSWSVDGAGLAVLFDPCGDLGWDLPPESASHLLPEILEREHGGELELTLREVDGTHAVCAVSGQLVRTTIQPGDLTSVPVAEGTATETVSETWEVEGELHWDLAADAVHSLDLHGDLRQEALTVKDPGQPGPDYESTFTVEGRYSLLIESVAVEVER